MTFVAGTTAAGKPLIGMVIVPTKAKLDENQKVHYLTALGLPEVQGPDGTMHPCVIATTESGGMTKALFPGYIRRCIEPLFPDATEDRPVLIKAVRRACLVAASLRLRARGCLAAGRRARPRVCRGCELQSSLSLCPRPAEHHACHAGDGSGHSWRVCRRG